MMKRTIKYLLPFLLLGSLTCTHNEWPEIEGIRPGYASFSDSSNYEVRMVKDLEADTIAYELVQIHVEFVFYTAIGSFEKMGIKKELYNESNNKIDEVELLSSTVFIDTLSLDILDKETLFYGINFNPDSMRSGYYFIFSTFMVPAPGDTIVSSVGNFLVEPEYINFCILPEILLGTYEAFNKQTGFKKDVEIRYIEVMPDVWFYVFTDFGLDWSTWNDHWYGTNFYMGCPLPGMTYFSVELAAWGIDQPNISIEMDNDDGVPETRTLRIMPWAISAESPNIGYYDAINKQFIFKDVYLIDTWWGIDNYVLEEVTFTYKEENNK